MTNVIVIGGGPGGTAAATRIAQLGGKVTLIEKDHLGGNCVSKNCIPFTGMMASLELLDHTRKAAQMGVIVSTPSIDLSFARKRIEGIVAELQMGTASLMESFGVKVIQGEAELVGKNTVQVDSSSIYGDVIILATGAVPQQPPIPIPGLLTVQESLDITTPPESLLIWGGEVIDVEFAEYFAILGSQVTLITSASGLLPEEDYEIGQRLQSILSERGVQIFTGASLKSAQLAGNAVRVVISQRKGEKSVDVERVFWARYVPNTGGLNLEKMGITVQDGAVQIDRHCQTSTPSIYAIGDLTGKPMYSHLSTLEGLVAAENIMGRKRELDLRSATRCIYTLPEIACTGLSETEAEDQGYDVEVRNISFETSSRAQTLNEAQGGIKVVFDRKFGKLLGVHIVGPRATDLIAQASLAIQLEALAEDFAWSVQGHPTLCESLVEAGRAYSGEALFIPKW